MAQWNKHIDPARFVQQGEEPKAMEELVSQQS